MNGPRVSLIVSALVLLLFAAADGATLVGAQVVNDRPVVEAEESTTVSDDSTGWSPPVVQAAIAAAAIETGLAPSAIVVLLANPVEWSDGSLGCPQPDLLYPQVITPGWWIQLGAGDEILEYHASDRGGLVVLCQRSMITFS